MIVYLAMIFAVFEILSTIFNQYFCDLTLFGVIFPVNISVVFFCLSFFVLDLTTELYDSKQADKLIYGKIICQLIFVLFGEIGILGSNLRHSQLDTIISATPQMILNSIAASFIGYKITTKIMQKMKLAYHGRLLPLRYLCSSLPGEIMFSLIFSMLSFLQGRTMHDFVMVFLTLTLIKIFLSFLFAILIIPVATAIRYFMKLQPDAPKFSLFS